MSNVTTLKWFHFDQNNSGGYFITNDVVAEDVYIQAENAEQAVARAKAIFAPYSAYCECCGERWSYYVRDKDGYDVPTNYDVPITDMTAGPFRKQAKLHHYDGTVEVFYYAQPIDLLTERS
jgi:hypothetical protein